ncbi:hypothetical protein AWB64_04821 [Caballeronia sordidicola]|uniref:Uncharacterized protein n=1 Tax=Caballeronia sordidicola TaxID=196367 RepID=A0A158HML9_CABSO|nr:hypothetical protein [Caballeronia sordidicola]SAL45652.1 hypothetical protein AWB64_04821 [Caballeronia sordidicola]
MNMNLSDVKDEFAAMLKDRPRGTTADITEHTVIYWDGKTAVGIHRVYDHPWFEDRFEIDDHFVADAHEHLAPWFANPAFSSRPDLVAWLDAGLDKVMER